MNKVLKEILKYVAIFAVLFIVLFCTDKLLRKKYMTSELEGAMVEEYYDNAGNNEVIFVGDCEVYENFSPITMWEEYGITSYIRGSAQQLVWQSYYLLKETFEYEVPKVAIFNVLSLKYNTPQSEGYNRMTLDGMKMSAIKLEAIEASMTEDEELISYIIPFIKFHKRWSELTEEDFIYWFKKDQVTVNGYLMRADIKPVDYLADYYEKNGKVSLTYDELVEICRGTPNRYNQSMDFGENAMKYLDMMAELCKENGVELVLLKSPSIEPYWYPEWDQTIEEYAAANDLLYINMLDSLEEMEIDFLIDTYDQGLHLNVYGAEKASSWLGKKLTENFTLTDYRNNEEVSKDWKEKTDFYYDMKADQEAEFAEKGYLEKFKKEETTKKN